MVKLIVLLLGLAVGFGGGVYWAHKNPEHAAKFSEEEERRFLEAQLAITEKIKAKLDELSDAASSKLPGGTSEFLSTGQPGPAVAEDVKDLKADAQQQEEALRRRIEALK